MSDKKVFCENCRSDVDFTIGEKQMEGAIKGEKYNYAGREAYCIDCGSEIYVAEVNDSNLSALYDAYRQKNNIVPLEVILAIPAKYAIGKRPLSLLLGWGEQTFSRYCDGDVPTKQYSDILWRIYDDPQYYAKVLESNKDNLKTEAAYEKSKRAVEALIAGTTESKTKIDSIIGYLLNRCEDITPLSLQKALYYIQGFHYAFYKEFVFSEDCEAWVHGPVYREVYFKYRDYRFDPIVSNNGFEHSAFSSTETAILDSVIKNICCYSGSVLVQFTHTETPWLATRGEIPARAASGKIIPKEQIADYFCAVKDKYNMINPNDIKVYAQNMFEQI